VITVSAFPTTITITLSAVIMGHVASAEVERNLEFLFHLFYSTEPTL
jgi:hypothetical protein